MKLEGSIVGRPKLRWMAGIEKDLKRLGRDDWRKVLAAARALTGL